MNKNIKISVRLILLISSAISFAIAAPSQVPMTGQSVNVNVPGANKGVAWPSPRFIAGSGATAECITDKLTGLMWPKNGIIGFESTNGGGPIAQPDYTNTTSNLNNMNWSNALTAVANMNSAPSKLCGYSDWRLPNKVELSSLVNYGVPSAASWLIFGTGNIGSPACDGACFNNVQGNIYASSSTDAGTIAKFWYVNLSGGLTSTAAKTGLYFIWPVRGGL